MKERQQIKVSKIEIRIGDKTLSLTPEEMKELKDILNKTFPDKEVKYVHSEPIVIRDPIYVERPADPWPWKKWDVICKADTAETKTLCVTAFNAQA